MLAGVMRKLLHGRGGGSVVVERRKQAQTTLRRGGIGSRIKLMLSAKKKVAGGVTGMVAHVMAHVRRHMRRRVRVVRRISLRMEMVMLLRRRLAGRRLHARPGIGGSSGRPAAAGRQLDAKIGEVVRMGRHTVQKSVHHRDGD